MWIASITSGLQGVNCSTKAGTGSVLEFEDWAKATYRQAGIEINETDLKLVDLIYASAIHQLEVLDHIDLEKFPATGIDLRHAPKPA
jgi:hypothetical protein